MKLQAYELADLFDRAYVKGQQAGISEGVKMERERWERRQAQGFLTDQERKTDVKCIGCGSVFPVIFGQRTDHGMLEGVDAPGLDVPQESRDEGRLASDGGFIRTHRGGIPPILTERPAPGPECEPPGYEGTE